MNLKDDWRLVEEAVKTHNKFVLTTHINPDGDGIGSELALYYYLKKMGKDACIINTSPTPAIYEFLDPDHTRISVFSDTDVDHINAAEVIFVLDISTMERLGRMSTIVKESKSLKICIDHHFTNHGLSDINVIHETACATAELIYDYLRKTEKGILEYPIAEALYVGMLTDTGSFRFSNSTPRSHIIAAELLECGIKPRDIFVKVYEMNPWEKVQLFGNVLTRLRLDETKKIVYTIIPQTLMKSSGAKQEDIEGFVEYLNTINGVEMALLFLELPGGKIKTSLRSKGYQDINQVAEQFKGGGHQHAAGILFSDTTMEDAVTKVVSACKKLL